MRGLFYIPSRLNKFCEGQPLYFNLSKFDFDFHSSFINRQFLSEPVHLASKRASSRSAFNKRRMSNESSEESDTELLQFSDQFVVTTLVDDSQGPARGVSGSSDYVTCAFSADLRFPTSLDVDLPPDRFSPSMGSSM